MVLLRFPPINYNVDVQMKPDKLFSVILDQIKNVKNCKLNTKSKFQVREYVSSCIKYKGGGLREISESPIHFL